MRQARPARQHLSLDRFRKSPLPHLDCLHGRQRGRPLDFDRILNRGLMLARDGVFVLRTDPGVLLGHTVLWANAGLSETFDADPSDIIGNPLPCLRSAPISSPAIQEFRDILARRVAARLHIATARTKTDLTEIELSLTPLPDQDGTDGLWLGIQRDSSQRHLAEIELNEARQAVHKTNERLWSAIEALPEAFVLYDADDRTVFYNSRFRNLFQYSGTEVVVGQRFEDILRTALSNGQYPEAIGREEDWLAERLARHRMPSSAIEQELPGDRHLNIREVRLPNGDTVSFGTDVTELKRQQKQLQQKAQELETAAITDPLTGLLNRRGLEQMMHRLAEEPAETAYGVLHVDLDRFKPINDVFGHAAGDFLLRHIANILTAAAGEPHAVARVGGDEFVVLIDAPCTLELAEALASKIIHKCCKPLIWDEKSLYFGASIGIALGEAARLPDLLHDADIALYEAKRAGRGRHHPFNADLRQRVEDRKRLSDDFTVGLDRGEIEAYFQPQVCAFSGRLTGVEALARWQHPERGTLGPTVFLPIAEDLGLLEEMDRAVHVQAVSSCYDLHHDGVLVPKLSVNVSLERITQSEGLSWLPESASLPFSLALEVLETLDIDMNFHRIAWLLDGLRDKGIAIELDDFGSGHASLTSLLMIKPDRIKLDQALVRAALDKSTGAGPMIRAISEMCRGLRVPLTAEGVETEDHADLMRGLGCDTLQGYAFARPLSRLDFRDWIKQHAVQQDQR